MKKLLLIFVSSVLALSASAEEFVPGWFLGVQGGAQYTVGESQFKNLISPTASFNVGYQFNPWFSLRGDVNGWQGKGWMIAPDKGYKFNYVQLGFDAIFNFADFSKNFKPHVVNPYGFIGLGGMVGINNKEVTDMEKTYSTVNTHRRWDAPTISPLGRVGLGVDFRLSDRVLLGLEVVDNIFADKMNSKKGEAMMIGNQRIDFDYNIAALLGLKVALGETYKDRAEAIAAAAAAAAAAEAAAAAAKAEADRLAAEKLAAEKAEAERLAAERAAAEAAAAAAAAEAYKKDICNENILFDLDKYVIRNSEEAKLAAIIECLKANPDAEVKVSGYADHETGSAKHNMELSKKRAEKVAKAITDAGISADRIITEYFGSEVNPFETPELNRVAVCVVNRSFKD